MIQCSLRALALACAFTVVAPLAGCSIPAPTSAIPQTYDFGPLAAYTRTGPAIPGTLLIAPVSAQSPLDHAGIVYRLGYEDNARPEIYAMSRWAAEPALLITDRLRSRFAAAAEGVVAPGYSARSDHTLRVELEDFSQHFKVPGESRVLLRARVTLLDSQKRTLVAQRVIDVERSAAGNAPGAVKALTEATDAFIEQVVKWTADRLSGKL